jgi:hypothetical protein
MDARVGLGEASPGLSLLGRGLLWQRTEVKGRPGMPREGCRVIVGHEFWARSGNELVLRVG